MSNPPPNVVLTTVESVAAVIAAANLHPGVTIEANLTRIHVSIAADHHAKSRVLRHWLDHLDAATMTMHRRPATSPEVRLTVGGLLVGVPVIVHTTYHQHAEPQHVAVITETLVSTSPTVLLDTLIGGESPTHDEACRGRS